MKNSTVMLIAVVVICLTFNLSEANMPPSKPSGGFTSEGELASYLRRLRDYYYRNQTPRYVYKNLVNSR